MTDYTKTTGETGTMMIRDLGSSVEFWFKAGYASDYWINMDFSYTTNGNTYNVEVDIPSGGNWKKIATAFPTYSQTVTFKLLTATGTTGMGGPTTFSVYINRGSVPGAPSKVTLTGIGHTTMYASFSDGGTGGLTIDARQIGYGTSSSGPQITVSSDRSTAIANLLPGVTYYFWARAHNAKGWGPWGPVNSAKTIAGARIKVGGVWKYAIPYVRVNGVWRGAKPMGRRAGVWKDMT